MAFVRTLSKADQARFWQRVDRRGRDECWPWIGARGVPCKTYGQFFHEGRQVRATHIVLILTSRRRPKNAFALHSCDNPPCCNPAHLRWGTAVENAKDKNERRRGWTKGGPAISDDLRETLIAGALTAPAMRRLFGLYRHQADAIIAERLDRRAAALNVLSRTVRQTPKNCSTSGRHK